MARLSVITSGNRRSGGILVLLAVLMVGLCGLVAFAVDYGYLLVVRGQLQRAADAAALAAAAQLIDEEALAGQPNMDDEISAARARAVEYAARNTANGHAVQLYPNYENAPGGDIVVGYLSDPTNLTGLLVLDGLQPKNTVQITTRLAADRGNAVQLFFAPAMGRAAANVSARAMASLILGIKGVTNTPRSGNINMMPFAIYRPDWEAAVVQRQGPDHYAIDPVTGQVSVGSDGMTELTLYPLDLFTQETDPLVDTSGPLPSGNFGTVDIGGADNSTAVLERQILSGVTTEDLAYHGGSLTLGDEGYRDMTGDTGISVGMKDAINIREGSTTIIMLFDSVVNPGNNATFRITRFVGVRIMASRLTGALKHRGITIQAACVVEEGTIPDPTGPSDYIYHPTILTR